MQGVNLALARTPEQRAERRRLVGIMRERMNSNPTPRTSIRRGAVASKDWFFLAPTEQLVEPEDIKPVESKDDEAHGIHITKR